MEAFDEIHRTVRQGLTAHLTGELPGGGETIVVTEAASSACTQAIAEAVRVQTDRLFRADTK